MRYFALLLLLIFVCSAPLLAQTPTPSPAPVSASYIETPYAETTEAWQNFAPPLEQISLEVPGIMSPGFVQPDRQPPASDSPSAAPVASPAPFNPAKSRSYMTLVGGDYYFVFSDAAASPSLNKTVYSFAESQAPGIDPNQIYAFADDFGFFHKILIVKSGDRVYTFQTVSQTKDGISAKRFFDGIKIKGIKLQVNEVEALQNIAAENSGLSVSCNPSLPPPPAIVSKPAESGISGGSGSLNGGSSESPSAPPAPTPVQTIPIKIISKPRPPYTDFARFYQVTGMTALRVTFLANGKIGSVSTVKRLPFGLTEQAIAAACQMQFEPASRNGVAYSVTRQVQYNFILY